MKKYIKVIIWVICILIVIYIISFLVRQKGWRHTPDTYTETIEECDNYCKSQGFWASGNMYNELTNECTCWHEPEGEEDLSYLDVEKCEQKEPNYRDGCYITIAEREKNIEYCKKVSSMNRKYCEERVERVS